MATVALDVSGAALEYGSVGGKVTREGQAQIDDLLVGRGSPYGITSFTSGIPSLRTADTDRGGRDGSTPGADLMGARIARLTLSARDGNPPGRGPWLPDVVDALAAVLRRRDGLFPLVWRPWRAAEPRALFVRPRRAEWAQNHGEWSLGIVDGVPIELYAPDPRWYDVDVSTALIEPPEGQSGRGYDRTYPLTYPGGVAGSVFVTNRGNVETWPRVTIPGPVTNPRIVNGTTGRAVELDLVVPDGQNLEVDMDARTVLLGGTASRYGSMTESRFWTLEPGVNELRYSAATTAAAPAIVQWRSAWNSG